MSMKIDKTKITKEQLEKALGCETAEELVALAKAEGFDITKDEAEAYLAEMDDLELDRKDLDKVAGGSGADCWNNCPDHYCPSYLI